MLDTDVVVSALIWGGVPFRLLQAAATGDVLLYTSPELLDELRDVLAREHLASRLAKEISSVERAIALYGELAISITPRSVPRVVLADPDDDHVIACALAARADALVSGDRHLLGLGSPWNRIAILTAAQAIEFLGTATSARD
ncbi:MAG: putative toxin-antitoxin system toxin component, PIN family [Xanthomonadales bacterium]|nr:putative toxin-antitoxin system toxin component, PIN family [Xanthomonadales bacterium]